MAKTSKNMQRTMVYLRPDQVTRLQQIFKQAGIRPAEAIRRAVDQWLQLSIRIYDPKKGGSR